MKLKKSLIYGSKRELGAYREYLVSQMYKSWGYDVRESTFTEDYIDKIDLIATKNDRVVYIQVKGFHKDWMKETIPVPKNTKNLYYLCFVNPNGKIYRKLIKKNS